MFSVSAQLKRLCWCMGQPWLTISIISTFKPLLSGFRTVGFWVQHVSAMSADVTQSNLACLHSPAAPALKPQFVVCVFFLHTCHVCVQKGSPPWMVWGPCSSGGVSWLPLWTLSAARLMSVPWDRGWWDKGGAGKVWVPPPPPLWALPDVTYPSSTVRKKTHKGRTRKRWGGSRGACGRCPQTSCSHICSCCTVRKTVS